VVDQVRCGLRHAPRTAASGEALSNTAELGQNDNQSSGTRQSTETPCDGAVEKGNVLSTETRALLEATEQPVLWLGMAGFAPAQRASLEASLASSTGSSRWRISSFGDADGWWVNGAKASRLPGGTLKVAAGLPTERALKLDLSEVNRPLAFAKPIASPEIEPLCTFDPDSQPSILASLLQFENWLRPVRAQFVLGALLIQRNSQERRGVYHLIHRGVLIAVLDFQEGQVALLPGVHPGDLWLGEWDKRPHGAAQPPGNFERYSTTQLAWAYVCRTDRDMLPGRYRTDTVYYRHVPRVPLRWLGDSQMVLLRELSTEWGTLDNLIQRTGLPVRQIEHDLACLYYAGSITTTPANAAAPQRDDSHGNSLGPGEDSLLERAHAQSALMTLPLRLDHDAQQGR
jgi:hypothetical protein